MGGRWNAQKTARPRTTRLVAVNERGLAIGQDHPRAVLSDHEVGLVLELRDQGFSYAWIARKMEVHKQTVAKICTGQRRCQTVAGHRTRGPR